jgi:hypothetical protein
LAIGYLSLERPLYAANSPFQYAARAALATLTARRRGVLNRSRFAI